METPADYLGEVLAESKKGNLLLKQVRRFYGPGFRYELIAGATSAFAFDVRSPVAPVATVRLAIESERTTEALIHELCHLLLPKLGFPIIYDTQGQIGYATGSVGRVINEVQHLIFVSCYLGAGFDLAKFLSGPPTIGYSPVAPLSPTREETLDFAGEYFRIKIASTLGYPNGAGDLVACRSVGVSGYPGFSEIANKLDEWFDDASFRDEHKYAQGIVDLIRILKMPLSSVQFCMLTPPQGERAFDSRPRQD